MVNMKKKIIRIAIISMMAIMLCGCSPILIAIEKVNDYNVSRADNIIINEETGEPYYMEFAPESDYYSVSLPVTGGGWLKQRKPRNEYHLVLDNFNESISVFIEAIPKDRVNPQLADLESFDESYRENVCGEFGHAKEVEVPFEDPAIIGINSYYYEVDGYSMTSKAQVSIFETEKAYYTFVITGEGNLYDALIDEINASLVTFREN